MARGVQRTDEEKLELLDKDIQEMIEKRNKIQSKIDDLNEQKQELLDAIEQKKLTEIATIISKSGKTPDEILAMLQGD